MHGAGVQRGEKISEEDFKAKMQALLKRLQEEKTRAQQAPDLEHVHIEPLCLTPAQREARFNEPPLLERTEEDLRRFCSSRPEDEVTESCWIAYNYFEEKKVSWQFTTRPAHSWDHTGGAY